MPYTTMQSVEREKFLPLRTELGQNGLVGIYGRQKETLILHSVKTPVEFVSRR